MGLGIDFGTTRTVVAYADRGNYPLVSFEGLHGDAVEWFPSIVAERDGELRFGFEALAVVDDPSFSAVRSFKRLLGGKDVTTSGMVTLGSTRLPVGELVYRFIAAMGEALRMRSNLPKSMRTAAELGGDDFDRVLAELVAAKTKLDLASLSATQLGRLLDHCREAKEALNASSRKISLDLEACLGSAAPAREVSLAASDYYDACTPLVEGTLEAMRAVIDRAGIDGAAADDPLSPDVAGLYVVGGASALPLVGRVLRTRFGRRVHRSPYPHASVCIGLAIASDAEAGFELDDRFSRNFGVFREAQGGAHATYDAIFTREMPLPRRGHPKLTVQRRYRAAHDVGHFRFFECSAFDAEGNPRGDIAPLTDVLFPFDAHLRAQEDLGAVPVRRLDREGPLVEERYAVDERGLVEFTIVDLESGFARTHVLGANP